MEREEYFDFGVNIGKAIFHETLKGNSLMASLYNDTHAEQSLKKLQVKLGTIFPHQDLIKRGIKMGVRVAGSEQRLLTRTWR